MKIVKGYTHHDGSIGVLVQFEVGSDFTTRTPEFGQFSDDVLMSIAWHFKHLGATVEPMEVPVPWIGDGDFQSLEEARLAACKTFQEDILINKVKVVSARL